MSFQTNILLRFESRLRQYPKPRIEVCCWLFVAIAGLVDYVTADNFLPLNFYLLPVALAAWVLPKRNAMIVTGGTSVVFVAIDLLSKTVHLHPYIHLWNVASLVFFFWMFLALMSQFHSFVRLRQSLAKTDRLSRILNQVSMVEALQVEIKRRERDKGKLSVGLVSRYQMPHATLGGKTSDETFWLSQMGQTIRMNLRGGELVGRMEDGRFTFILPNAAADVCRKVVEKIHYALNGMARSHQWPFLFNIAAVTYSELPAHAQDILETLASRVALLATKPESGTCHELIPDENQLVSSPASSTETLSSHK